MSTLSRAIVVCALGYFIDIFDIQLFAVLRVASLTDLGVAPHRLSTVAGYILNAQMLGMILGAFLWGWLGDRFGRLKALYGSIFVYSVGTLSCSFVHDPAMYGLCRFIAGFGLAGETGAAVTLVAELMPQATRGWGVTIVGGIGAFGPVFATLISRFLDWRTTYLAAGFLGLVLLVLRMRLLEPALFQKISQNDNLRGSLKLLMRPRQVFILLCCVALGAPVTYAANLLNFYSLELSRDILAKGEIFDQKTCLMLFYLGLGCGNILNGTVSQLWSSRRKSMGVFLACAVVANIAYLLIGPLVKFTMPVFYGLNFTIGVCQGSLVIVTLITAEHFGTNVRATVTALTTNIVRGCVIPMVFAFQFLRESAGVANAVALIGCSIFTLAFLALCKLHETHGTDLDYTEKLESKTL